MEPLSFAIITFLFQYLPRLRVIGWCQSFYYSHIDLWNCWWYTSWNSSRSIFWPVMFFLSLLTTAVALSHPVEWCLRRVVRFVIVQSTHRFILFLLWTKLFSGLLVRILSWVKISLTANFTTSQIMLNILHYSVAGAYLGIRLISNVSTLNISTIYIFLVHSPRLIYWTNVGWLFIFIMEVCFERLDVLDHTGHWASNDAIGTWLSGILSPIGAVKFLHFKFKGLFTLLSSGSCR